MASGMSEQEARERASELRRALDNAIDNVSQRISELMAHSEDVLFWARFDALVQQGSFSCYLSEPGVVRFHVGELDEPPEFSLRQMVDNILSDAKEDEEDDGPEVVAERLEAWAAEFEKAAAALRGRQGA
jgi:hypothetical protein